VETRIFLNVDVKQWIDKKFKQPLTEGGGTCWHSWLRHCATSRKVAGLIFDGVIGIFYWHNTSGRTMALGLTQPLTEMSIRNIPWEVKAAGAYSWQPYHLHVPIVLKSGSLSLLEPSGSSQSCNEIDLPFFDWRYLCYFVCSRCSLNNSRLLYSWVGSNLRTEQWDQFSRPGKDTLHASCRIDYIENRKDKTPQLDTRYILSFLSVTLTTILAISRRQEHIFSFTIY